MNSFFYIVRRITLVPRLFRFFLRSDISLWIKVLVVATVFYILFPFDAIPDFLPVLGWIEDIILGLLVYNFVRKKVCSKEYINDRRKDDNTITVKAKVIKEDKEC